MLVNRVLGLEQLQRNGAREYLYPGNYSLRGARGSSVITHQPRNGFNTYGRGAEGELHSLTFPSPKHGLGGCVGCEAAWWGGVARYICKMDYVGFAEFNIDTDSS